MLEYRHLETVSRKSLLGIRFWDPALNAKIGFGLDAVLYPLDNIRKRVSANYTRSGIYAFNNIPGMYDVETQSQDEAAASPPASRQYVLEVQDTRERFAPVALQIELPLPYNGLFLVDDDSGSPATAPRGFILYSSINRPAAAGSASIVIRLPR